MKHIGSEQTATSSQLSSQYQAESEFRVAFNRIIGTTPTKLGDENILKASWIDTCVGPMVAIADDHYLYVLEFLDRKGLEREVERFRIKMKAVITQGRTKPIDQIQHDLTAYFTGKCDVFTAPFYILGTSFQQTVWKQLQNIPTGETRSYGQIAEALGKPTAYRAVAQANGSNQLAIVIPCHRVINADGQLGGYAGGVTRKKWLLEHEKKMMKTNLGTS
ncbi:methylated-DNA--[protein]-cysteine S-methyltransferase [Longirhabdus pacifica]|uniref:methylated-DNA--[protein]-cysteine S-methyltransferase n=1 Tax=Longirhabdus pacifica TaxID=2305227 RepID=UPI0013E8EDD8|nr:methylated-DNA--[protein]-cysteine S-methyltransferase [Longirhabdus pacifica]